MTDKERASLTVLKLFMWVSLAFNIVLSYNLVNLEGKVKSDNKYMIEQVKKLDENIITIEGILEDQHTINDELANRLGNYADNVKAVNELLAKLKE